MKKFFQLLFGAAMFLLPNLSTLHAQTNLSVQGTIQNFNGTAVDNGLYDVTFKLYTTDAGGTAVWSETQSVQVTGGVYSVLLGSVNPLTAAFNQTYYLGITLPGGPELTPRSRLTSSPYALSLIGQGNIFPSTGPVGAGTATPAAGNELHVKDAVDGAQVLVEGATTSKVVVQSADGSEIEFKKGANSASITYDGTNISIENLNLVFDAGLNLPAGQTIKYNNLPDWRLIDVDNFDTGYEGWDCYSDYSSSTTIGFSREILGSPVNNGYVLICGNGKAFKKAINLAGIPHTQVKVIFTVHYLDKFQASDVFQMWGGFSTVLNPYGGTNGQVMISWSHTASGEQPSTVYYANNPGDFSKRAEMVISNSSNTIYAIITGYNSGSFGAIAIGNVEIWVK